MDAAGSTTSAHAASAAPLSGGVLCVPAVPSPLCSASSGVGATLTPVATAGAGTEGSGSRIGKGGKDTLLRCLQTAWRLCVACMVSMATAALRRLRRQHLPLPLPLRRPLCPVVVAWHMLHPQRCSCATPRCQYWGRTLRHRCVTLQRQQYICMGAV